MDIWVMWYWVICGYWCYVVIGNVWIVFSVNVNDLVLLAFTFCIFRIQKLFVFKIFYELEFGLERDPRMHWVPPWILR